MEKLYILKDNVPFDNRVFNTATKNDEGIIYCDYSDEPTTFEEYQKKHPELKLKIVSSDEMEKMFNEYNSRISDDWEEITEDRYDDMLNVLPPQKWFNGGFYNMEAYSGLLHGFYQSYHGKFYASTQPIHAKREDVLKSLTKFING